MTRLSKPKRWVLVAMNEMETAEMIEKYIEHYAVDKNGDRYPVHYPTNFVRHYMKRDDGALPIVVTICTMPIVLGYGELLAPPGFDRLRGIQFIIPDDLRAILPKRKDCGPAAVKKAIEFLLDEWLTDVKTSFTGKCIIIADALTMIERSLLEQRPAFFYTAGRRGGGKTTTLQMLVMAITGMGPVIAAWSTNEEERRKALLAYFIEGNSYVIWDNIARGSQISCPHIERSCTSMYYADRKLGVSELVNTAASMIHHFTGNNIRAKGDMASRSLEVRIEVDRVDPENREFRHNDPLGWTEDNRVEILQALYTILLGNPQLREPEDAPGKTRFKMWWRMVGSAVEHAARLMVTSASSEDVLKRDLQLVDFQKLFVDQEVDDEESASLSDVLEILDKWWPGQSFSAKKLTSRINDRGLNDDDVKTVREFLFPGAMIDYAFSSKSVGRALKRHQDDTVRSGDRTLVLRSGINRISNSLTYFVEVLAVK